MNHDTGNIEMKSKEIVIALFIALLLALFLSPFASEAPDGLEKVAEIKGFMDKSKKTISSPFADYHLPWIKNQIVSTSIAGGIGTLAVFFIAYAVGRILKRK